MYTIVAFSKGADYCVAFKCTNQVLVAHFVGSSNCCILYIICTNDCETIIKYNFIIF